MKKALRILANKYLLTAVAFIVWTMYFDQNDWVSMRQKQRELQSVKDNIRYLNGEIVKMNKERESLQNNPAQLEGYAREKYRMKHGNEDVYVIDDKQ